MKYEAVCLFTAELSQGLVMFRQPGETDPDKCKLVYMERDLIASSQLGIAFAMYPEASDWGGPEPADLTKSFPQMS